MGDPLTVDLIYDGADVAKEDVPLNKIQFFAISLMHLTDISIITKLESLTVIQLRLCNLVVFPEEFFSMPNLESIDLSGNSIASLQIPIKKEDNEGDIQDIWQKLPKLTTLNLSENSLNDINEIMKLKTIPKLKHLVLTGNICLTANNAFNRICEAFPNLLALNDLIITSQHRAIVMNFITYIQDSAIPLVETDNYLFLYVKYLRCSVNERFARRHRVQFFCINRVLRHCSFVTKIQSVFRGFIARQRWENMKKSTLFLQTRIKFFCHLRSCAAMKIQGLFRCHKLKHVVLEHRNARKIQGAWRRYLSRDNAIIDLFENKEITDQLTYQFYITNESLFKLYKFLEDKGITYRQSIINNSMLIDDSDDFKVIRFGPLKKRNLPGSPAIYYNVDENILIRRNRHHEPTSNSIWCNHDHNKLTPVEQVSKNGVNYNPICPFRQIKYIPYTRDIRVKKLKNYQKLKLVTFTDVPLFRKIIKAVAHSFPEGVVLFPLMFLNESVCQFTLHCSARMFNVRNRDFHKMKKYVIEKRAAKSIKSFIRTNRIVRYLHHLTRMLRYSETIPEAMTFFVPQNFLNVVKLDFKNQKDLLQYENEHSKDITFKTEKPLNTHLIHSDFSNAKKSSFINTSKEKEKENGFRNRMKNLINNDMNSFNFSMDENSKEDDVNSVDFDNVDLDPKLRHGFPIKFPAEFGFTEDRIVSLSHENPNPFLACFIPSEPIIFQGKSLSMLPTFETTIRPALPSMFSVPITKKTINLGRIMRITFSSPEEAFRRLFIFAYLTADMSRFMIDVQVVEYCAALLIQNHWRGFLYRRDYRHLASQKERIVNPAILLKQEVPNLVKKKKDEPPPTFKKMVREELPPEIAIANLRGDYRSWESLHRHKKISELYEFNDKPYKSSIVDDRKIDKNDEDEKIITDSMKNVGLVNDLENAYVNLSKPDDENYENYRKSMKSEMKKQRRNLIEMAKTTNGHLNEESRPSFQPKKPPPFEIEVESQTIFGQSFPKVKELDLNVNLNTLKELDRPKEPIKPIDTSEEAYESIKQFYTFQKRESKKDDRFKSPPAVKKKSANENGGDVNDQNANHVDFDDDLDNYYASNTDTSFQQPKMSPHLTSTPRTPHSANKPRVQFVDFKSSTTNQVSKSSLKQTEAAEISPSSSQQKLISPSVKKPPSKVKIDVLANTSKAIKKGRPESAIDRTNKPKMIDSSSRPSSRTNVKPPKPLIEASSSSSQATPVTKRQEGPQIRVPTPKLQTAHYKAPQMKNAEFTESLVAPTPTPIGSSTAPVTPIQSSHSKSRKSDNNNDSGASSNLSSAASVLTTSMVDYDSLTNPFTSLMITSPQWTDNTMRDALRKAFTKLVRLHQLGIEIEQAMVTDNTIAEKMMKTQKVREKVTRAREELKTNKEEELIDLMERNKIEQLEREEKVREVRARTAMTRNRNVNKVRKIHRDAINKYKKERDFALNFVSVSRKIAQQIEQKQLKAEKRKELEEAANKVAKQHEEAKEAIESYKQKVKEMEEYKRKVAQRDKVINEEKRAAQNEAYLRRIEMLSTIKEDEKLMKESYHIMKNQRKVVPTNVPQPIETDEVEGATLIIRDYMGPNLGETEAHLLCQIISEIV